jgi:hypothetical protein
MSRIKVNNISPGADQSLVSLGEMQVRIVKDYRFQYSGGSWEPSDSYQWIPNAYVDYTPLLTDSRIRFTINLSFAHTSGHAIMHCIFYANSVEIGRHNIAGQSPEHRHCYVWDVASWGGSLARIGYQARRYGGSNIPRVHGTHHWDGAGSNQNAHTQIYIDEYVPMTSNVITWTTGSSVIAGDASLPSLTLLFDAPASTYTSVTTQALQLKFNENIAKGALNAITLQRLSGGSYLTAYSWPVSSTEYTVNGRTLTLAHATYTFVAGTTYRLVFGTQALKSAFDEKYFADTIDWTHV